MHDESADDTRDARYETTPVRKRIVLAEDHDDTRVMLAKALTLLGYEVHEASNGTYAFQLADEVKPHAVIADIQMPGLNGLDLARELRARHGKKLRLLALTGLPPKTAWLKTMEAGFDYYLLKPVKTEDLVPYIEGDLHPLDESWKSYLEGG